MDYSDSYENQPKTSKFNAAGLINIGLAELWKEAYNFSKKANLAQWNSVLNCIWIELGGDVEEKSNEDIAFNKLNKDIQDLGGLVSVKASGFSQPSMEKSKTVAGLYQALLKKSLFLKRLQYKQGKGTAYEDNASDYMDN